MEEIDYWCCGGGERNGRYLFVIGERGGGRVGSVVWLK